MYTTIGAIGVVVFAPISFQCSLSIPTTLPMTSPMYASHAQSHQPSWTGMKSAYQWQINAAMKILIMPYSDHTKGPQLIILVHSTGSGKSTVHHITGFLS